MSSGLIASMIGSLVAIFLSLFGAILIIRRRKP